MLNTNEIKNKLINLLGGEESGNYIGSNGLLKGIVLYFDRDKIEEVKIEIAKILDEMGISEIPLISLEMLTKLKNGEVWNKLETKDDFRALELLLAVSDACGFISNDDLTYQRNLHQLGNDAYYLTPPGIISAGSYNEWLKRIREIVSKKMFFISKTDKIKEFANKEEIIEDIDDNSLNSIVIINLANTILTKDGNNTCRGITVGQNYYYNKEKLEEAKEAIALYLKEIGLDEKAWTSIRELMSLKDGGVWNKFKTYEDYQALDYLVALANACGFIDNNIGVELMNINLIGKDESMLISTYGREEVDDDNKWLDSIKKSIIDKVHYTVRPDEIKAYLPIQK